MGTMQRKIVNQVRSHKERQRERDRGREGGRKRKREREEEGFSSCLFGTVRSSP